MKRFSFRLERILTFRRNQRRQTELRLQELHGQETLLLAEEQSVVESEHRTKDERAGISHTSGLELRAYQSYIEGLHSRRDGIRTKLQGNRANAEHTKTDLVERDRQVKLLEKLRERRLHEHRRQEDREQQIEAGESSLNRWRRR